MKDRPFILCVYVRFVLTVAGRFYRPKHSGKLLKWYK